MEFPVWFAVFLSAIGAFLTFLQFRVKVQDHKFKLYEKRLPLYRTIKDFELTLCRERSETRSFARVHLKHPRVPFTIW